MEISKAKPNHELPEAEIEKHCQATELNKGGSCLKDIPCKRAGKKGRRGRLRRGEGHGWKARRRGRAWAGKAIGRSEGDWMCCASVEREWQQERGVKARARAGEGQ